MSLKTIIIYQNKILHNILNEISENINYKILYAENIDFDFQKFENYLVITSNKIQELKNQLVFNNFPVNLNAFIENVSIAFLKQEYSSNSRISVGNYELDLNSRVLSFNKKNLDLTEMEANLILFLKKSNEPETVKNLQKKVWGHMPDLETHTVETHVYRLRKKIKDKFQDNNFIKSFRNGYQII